MFQPHCNYVEMIREKVVCLGAGPTQTCVVVTVTIRIRNPKGEIRLKGQSRTLRIPDYLIANLGSECDFFKDNKRLTYTLVVYTSYYLFYCIVSHT